MIISGGNSVRDMRRTDRELKVGMFVVIGANR